MHQFLLNYNENDMVGELVDTTMSQQQRTWSPLSLVNSPLVSKLCVPISPSLSPTNEKYLMDSWAKGDYITLLKSDGDAFIECSNPRHLRNSIIQ